MDDRKLSDALENLTQRISLLNEVFAMREPFLVKNLNFAQRLTLHKQKGESFYKVLQIPLDAATENYMEAVSGQLFYINRIFTRSTGADAAGSVRCKFFRNDQQHTIALFGGQGVVTPFDRVYMGWDAQSGVTAEIIVSEDFDLFRIIDNRLATSITSISTLASLTDITGDIAGVNSLPSGATQVAADGEVADSATAVTIYTVPAGKTLKLTAAQMHVVHFENGGEDYELYVANSGGTKQYSLLRFVAKNSAQWGEASSEQQYTPPLEIPAGSLIQLKHSVTGTAYSAACIAGYTV